MKKARWKRQETSLGLRHTLVDTRGKEIASYLEHQFSHDTDTLRRRTIEQHARAHGYTL
jgi:hypothetical protein